MIIIILIINDVRKIWSSWGGTARYRVDHFFFCRSNDNYIEIIGWHSMTNLGKNVIFVKDRAIYMKKSVCLKIKPKSTTKAMMMLIWFKCAENCVVIFFFFWKIWKSEINDFCSLTLVLPSNFQIIIVLYINIR